MRKVIIVTLFFFIVLGSVNGLSLKTEEDIEHVTERKMAEVYEKKLKDLEKKSFLQDKILEELQRKFETQNEIMQEQARKLEKQEKLLKEHELKFMIQDKTLKTYERNLEIQNRVSSEHFKLFDQHDELISKHKSDITPQNITNREYTRHATRDKELNNQIGARKSKISKRLSAGGVSFSTQLTATQHHIGLSQTIKFDRVDLNDGNGYNVHTGSFTAPQSGVYLFAYFLGHGTEATSHAQVWLELMHNGHKINAGVVDTFHAYQDIQGGNIAIIRLNAGDSVWVEAWHQNDAFLVGNGFTTFSGTFLY